VQNRSLFFLFAAAAKGENMKIFMSRLVAKAAIASAVLSATVLTTVPGASAATLNYVFEPNSSITVLYPNPNPYPRNLVTDTITGSFTFDTSTDTLSAINITLSGSPSYFIPNPITFRYGFTPFNVGNQAFGIAYAGPNDSSSYLMAIQFYGLGGTSSPLAAGSFYNGPYGNASSEAGGGGAVSGGVNIAATPLPGALPLFAGGLGVMGFLARRRKRKSATLAAA
jgi:hypothetical protein